MSDIIDPMAGFDAEADIADLNEIMQSEVEDTDALQNVSCDLPHWKVNRSELVQIMNTARSFPIKTALVFGFKLDKDIEGKPFLHVHYDNRDSLIEATLPVLNEDFYETDKIYFIEGTKLYTLLNLYPNFVFAFDSDSKIHFWSNLSQVKLETHNLNWDSLVHKIPDSLHFMQFPMNKEQVLTFKALFGAALKQSDNALLIDGDHVEAFFTLFLYRLNKATEGLTENFVLRKIDLFPLAELYALGGEVFFAFEKDHVYFKWNNGYLILKRVPYQEKNFMYPKTFSGGASEGEFSMDVALIKKALRYSQFIKSSAIVFTGDENQKIITSPKADTRFEVGVGELPGEGFTLVCDNLLRIVNTISDKEVAVKMLVTESGVELIVNNPQAPVEISLSRISSAQHRREEALTKKKSDRQKQIDNLAAKGEVRGTKAPTAEELGINLDL